MIRSVFRRRFPHTRLNVTVGRRWFWDGLTIDDVRRRGSSDPICHDTRADDPAAIIFTTGSTGPPKGVLYRHGNFDRQVTEIRDFYGIQPGEIDLAAFPLFGLFNSAMGVTTVVPDMDASRPAQRRSTQHRRGGARLARHSVVRIARYLESRGRVLPEAKHQPAHACAACFRRVPPCRRTYWRGCVARLPPMAKCIRRMALPSRCPWRQSRPAKCSPKQASAGQQGAGTCVGRRFPGIEWKVIAINDGPIAQLADAAELPLGEIGELIVSGPVVTREYVTRTEVECAGKDLRRTARLASHGRRGLSRRARTILVLWPHGASTANRLRHRCTPFVAKRSSTSIRPCIVRRWSALGQPGRQRPVIVVEPWREKRPRGRAARAKFLAELAELALRNELTACIGDFLIHTAMPVDVRHNAKIFREKLAAWAARKLR